MNADEALRFIEELIRTGGGKPLNDLQRSIFRGAWVGRDYKEIHQDCGQVVGLDHIMRNVGPRLWKQLSKLASDQLGEPIEVRKEALQGPIEQLRDRLMPQTLTSPDLGAFLNPLVAAAADFDGFDDLWNGKSLNRKQDWGEAPDAALFQGRRQELEALYQWVEEEGCRLIALVGTAGCGKTDLSVKLTERLRDRFELVIWRSLDPAFTGQPPPMLPDLLTELTQFLVGAPSAELASFMECIRKQRCLIVLDGFEAVFQSKVLSGAYRLGYEGYSDLLKRVSDSQHLSCVLITSREKPREIEAREGDKAPVRSHHLPGLAPEDVQNLFFAKGTFLSTDRDWRSLTHQYSGNPHFLQQVATVISSAFGRDVCRFLTYRQTQALFVGDIRRSLEQQLEQLSDAEALLIYQLAKHREPATLEEIQQFVKTSMSPHQLLEVLMSLVRRSLLKSSAISYSLLPLVTEYLGENQKVFEN